MLSSEGLSNVLAQGRVTQLIYVAVKSGFLTHLDEANCDLSHLVDNHGYDSDTCARFIRWLKVIGIATDTALTPFGKALLPARRSRLFLELIDAYEFEAPTLQAFTTVLRSGVTAFQASTGSSIYEFNRLRPVLGDLHDELLAYRSIAPSIEVADHLDLSWASTLVDVGGGYGMFCRRVVENYATIRCTVFDTSRVVAMAASHAPVCERLTFEAGDFFRSVPPAADTYVLKWVLHNWPDDACRKILGTVRDACKRESCLVVAEWILPEHDSDLGINIAMADMTMLLYHGGRERRAPEIDTLLAQSGFVPGPWVLLPSGRSFTVAQVR